jgi:hypothetical protein
VHEQRAVTKFIREYRSRWRALTVCADGYVIAECSNGAPLP